MKCCQVLQESHGRTLKYQSTPCSSKYIEESEIKQEGICGEESFLADETSQDINEASMGNEEQICELWFGCLQKSNF